MTIPLQLHTDVFVCNLDGLFVVLDGRRNRYLSFSGPQSQWFQEMCVAQSSEALTPDAKQFLDRLVALGLIATAGDDGKALRPCAAEPAHGSMLDNSQNLDENPEFGDYLTFIRALLRVWLLWRAKRTNIPTLLGKVSLWKKRCQPLNHQVSEALVDRAHRFHFITPYFFTSHDECMFRSLVLCRYLALHRIPFDFIIGVRTAPFGAHCWVETGGIALNEHKETTLNYRKILTI